MVTDLISVLNRPDLVQFAENSSISYCSQTLGNTLRWCHDWGFSLPETKDMALDFTEKTYHPWIPDSLGDYSVDFSRFH